VFTARPDQRGDVIAAGASAGVPVTRIGEVQAGGGLRLVDGSGRPLPGDVASFDHFKS
jgi:thiamine-monophosphate kinase